MPHIKHTPFAARTHTSAIFAKADPASERGWTVALREKPATDELEIAVYDVIGSGLFSGGVMAKDILAKLQSAPRARRIVVRVNSIGGVVDEAKAMANLLLERAANGAEIVGRVDSIAASAASYLLTAATRVEMPANSFQMLHGVRSIVRGTASDLEETAKLFRRTNEQIAEAYAAASERRGKAKTKDDYLALFESGDTYLTADEAIEYGLADAKIEHIKLVACLADIESLTGAPAEVRSALVLLNRAEPVPPATTPPKPSAGPDARQLNQLPDIGNGDPNMKMISLVAVATALGFSAEQIEKAEEKDILDAASKLNQQAASQPPAVNVSGVKLVGVATEAEATSKIQDFQRAVLQLLGTTGKATPAEAIAAVLDWKSGAEQTGKLTKQVGELTEESRVAKRDGAIEKMSREGILPPARHEWARMQFATAEAVESFCSGMPQGFFNSIKTPEGEAVAALTEDEKRICQVLGMSEEKYIEEKKLLRKAG